MKTTIATTTGFHLRRLAKEMAIAGLDVNYFSSLPGFRMRRDGLDSEWATSLFLPLLPTSAIALLRGTRWQMPAVEAMLKKTDEHLARKLQPSDIFIGLSSMAVRSAGRARDLGAKVVIERGSRHVLSQNQLISNDGGRPLSEFYIERELASYMQADVITVLSQHAADSFVDEGFSPDRIFVCPLGVDLSLFTPSPRPPDPLRILFVGGWSHRKGVDVLVNAMRNRPNWKLTHIGSAADIVFPRDLPGFSSMGHQDHHAIAKAMKEHHILVLPSREDGFGMVLLEALAAGLPIVASSMTGGVDIRNSITNKEWVELVKPGDHLDLLRGLESMAYRESLTPKDIPRHRLSESDRQYFSWKGYARRYVTFLNQLHFSMKG